MFGVTPYAFIDGDAGYFSLPSQFEKFGRPAVLSLLDLLNHPDWTMRARAGMVLEQLTAVEARDLPAIVREARNGNGWISQALARIGTPEAISGLIDVLKRSPILESGNGAALRSLGKKAAPLMLEALSCKTDRDCSAFFIESIGELGSEPGVESREIQARLVDLATTVGQSENIRYGALLGLRRWPLPYDQASRLRIRALLAESNETIRTEALIDLVIWSDEAAVEPLLAAIDKETGYDRVNHIRWLGDMGPVAHSAAPRLVSWLKDDDWNARDQAARALGKIRYAEAIPDLIAAIASSDWKVTNAAMSSLRRFGSPESRAAVYRVAQTYWQPGIRAAAQRLLDEMPDPKPPDPLDAIRSPIQEDCKQRGGAPEESRLVTHPDLVHATIAGDTLAVAGGKLVALDHGEWGGALEFWPKTGLPRDLIKDNVTAVLSSLRGIFATTGTGHGGLDNGFIYRVAQDANGSWYAERIWRLPGAPARVLHTPQGIMGIYTNYGDVIFRPDSGMEWISCPARE